MSLSLGYDLMPSFRWSSAPELLDAHSVGIIDDKAAASTAYDAPPSAVTANVCPITPRSMRLSVDA
jgi:hypothetical protein